MIPWNTLNIFDHVDDKVNCFNTLFGDIVNKHAPIKEMTFKYNSSIVLPLRSGMK